MKADNENRPKVGKKDYERKKLEMDQRKLSVKSTGRELGFDDIEIGKGQDIQYIEMDGDKLN